MPLSMQGKLADYSDRVNESGKIYRSFGIDSQYVDLGHAGTDSDWAIICCYPIDTDIFSYTLRRPVERVFALRSRQGDGAIRCIGPRGYPIELAN